MAGSVGGRATAVKIDGVDAAHLLLNLRDLIDGHTVGDARAAVSQEDDDGAVLTQADGISGGLGGVAGQPFGNDAVLNQIERSGDGFGDIVRGGAEVADGIGAVLQNREIRLLVGRAVHFEALGLDEVALHHQIAAGLAGLHIIVVGVDGGHNGLAGSSLIGCGLGGGGLQIPGQVLGRGGTALRRAAGRVVGAIGRLELHRSARRNGSRIAQHLRGTGGVVQDDLRFGHALCNRVIRLGNQNAALRDGDIGRLSGCEGCGTRADKQRDHQQSAECPLQSRMSFPVHVFLLPPFNSSSF